MVLQEQQKTVDPSNATQKELDYPNSQNFLRIIKKPLEL
jgi:hypothetical protein